MDRDDLCITRNAAQAWRETRRPGIREKRLLGVEQSRNQNLVLVETDARAEVEQHEVRTSESIFVIEGHYEVVTQNTVERLGPGDCCHFPPGSSHGLRCLEGPGRFLAIFAPPAMDRP